MSDSKKNICHPEVFDAVFRRYARDIKAFLFYKFQDPQQTEDVLQETFIKLWENCQKVALVKVKNYLFTVANNLFLDIKRHEAIVRKHKETYINYDHSESADFFIIEQEFMDRLEKLIEQLPHRQREIFLLNRIEKKKYREIAEMLSISIKTVEKHMHAAMLYLREHLGRKI